jgi:hypothetical protein
VSRWILVAVLLVAGSASGKHLVVRREQLAFVCASAPTWDRVKACIEQHGWTALVVRTAGRAKLLEVSGTMPGPSEPALALYVQQRDGRWQLGGLFEPGSGAKYEVLDLQPLTIAHTAGYRFEIGTRRASVVSFDGVTTSEGIMLARHVLFCSGSDFRCTDVVPSCDVLVAGRPYSTFHGEVVLADRMVRVEGDATLAPPSCAGEQQQPLAWP